MPVKSWNVGDVLSAADMNAWTVPLAVIKPADTGRNTTTTLTADPDLVLPLASGAVYQLRLVIQYKGGTNGSSDMQVSITVPAGATGFYFVVRRQVTGPLTTNIDWTAFGSPTNAGTNGTGVTLPLLIEASVTTAGTAGNVSLTWAQNTSNGTNTTIMANSIMIAQRIG